MRLSSRRIGLLVLVVLLSVTGCTVVQGRPIAQGEIPDSLLSFYTQKLSWGSCDSYGTDQDSRDAFSQSDEFQCARLTVPLDYTNPSGRTASIGLLRIPASDPSQRIGSLVMNPGGPGESGMVVAAEMADTVAKSPLGQRFDLVGFDPRGVGASRPQVRCLTDAEQDKLRLEVPLNDEQAENNREQAENKTFAQDCTKRVGKDVLAHIGSEDVAQDMDVLRFVLGDRQLTYLGFSYGTLIGTVYAEKYPHNVRAMILDGAVDPAQTNESSNANQGDGFDNAFRTFAQWCVKQRTCGLGTDPNVADHTLDQLSDPLKTTPIAVGNRKLSYTDIQVAVTDAMYSKDLWSKLNTGLIELSQGKGATLLALADDYLGRDQDGHYSNQNDVFTAVKCADYPHQTQPQQAYDGTTEPLDACAFWPVPNSRQLAVPSVPGLATTLVISTTHDPATPYESGVNLAEDLHARLLTFEGTQHTAFLDGNTCVDRYGSDYLIDGTLPPTGARCS